MQQLNRDGFYTVPKQLHDAVKSQFAAGCCGDEKAQQTIARVFRETGYLCDPHTATAWAVAEDYVNLTGDNTPMVVLSTASPYKFPTAVLEALGEDTTMDEFAQMERLQAVSGVAIPKNLATLQGKPERHTSVIDKANMLIFVKQQ